jgi:hypothetical protein
MAGAENREFTVLASGARTATFNGEVFENLYGRGIVLWSNVTANAGTAETLDIKVQSVDPVSGSFFDIPGAVFVQTTDQTDRELVVYPGVAETANVSVSDVLPRHWRLVYTIGGSAGQSFTFSMGGCYVL